MRGEGKKEVVCGEKKKKKGIFVSIRSSFLLFDWWVIFANMRVIFTPLTN